MKYSIDQLVSYIHVYEANSFTAAASRLDLSKAIVSQHVKTLEEHLKVQLLHRTTRKLTFTDAGHELYEELKPLFEKIDSTLDHVQSHSKQAKGNLNIILNANLARVIRKEMIPNFLSQHPDIHLKLTITEDPRDHLGEDFDILVFPVIQGTQLPDMPLVAKPLFTMPVGIYASPVYLAKHGTPVSPSDLDGHNCMAPISGNLWPFKNQHGEIYYVETRGNLSANHDAVFRHMVIEGHAIGYAYPRLFIEEIRNGQVLPILDDHLDLNVDVYALYHQSYYTPLKIKAFLHDLRLFYQNEQKAITESIDLHHEKEEACD